MNSNKVAALVRQNEAADGGKTGIMYAGCALTDGGDDKLLFFN